jgi:hypothetical protein
LVEAAPRTPDDDLRAFVSRHALHSGKHNEEIDEIASGAT